MHFSSVHRLFLLLAFLCCFSGKAQNDLAILAEPELKINLSNEGPWSYDFGIEYRNLAYLKEFKFEGQHVELSHTTRYSLGKYGKVGLGIKYRFKEVFEALWHDELRFIEEYSLSHKRKRLKIGHRFRFEQRLRENTSFRLRYRLSFGFPLTHSKEKIKGWEFKANAAILWSFAKTNRSELEQRLGISLKKGISENTNLSFGPEYRYQNYIHDPESALFFLGTLSINL